MTLCRFLVASACLGSSLGAMAGSGDWAALMQLGRQAAEAGDSASAEREYRQALELIDQGNPQDPRLHATVTALAVALIRQDRCVEAAPWFEHEADIDGQAPGDWQKMVAGCLARRAQELISAEPLPDESRCRKAETFLRKVLTAVERVFGEDHLAIAQVLDQLSEVSILLGGAATERVALQERRLAIFEKVYGPESYELVFALVPLAGAVFWLDSGRAERIEMRIFELTQRHHGDDAQRMADACRGLEAHYQSTHDEESRRAWARQRRKYEERTERTSAPAPLQIVSEAIDREQQGQLRRASSLMRQAVEMARATYDAGESNLYAVLDHAAGFHQRHGELERAEEYLVEAERYARSRAEYDLAPLHGVLTSLAQQDRSRKRWSEAIDHALAALELGRQLGSPADANDLLFLGDLYNESGQHARALDVLAEALALHERFYGPQARMTINPLFRLADTSIAIGDRKRAEEYLLRTIAILEAVSGPEDPFLRSSRIKLQQLRAERP